MVAALLLSSINDWRDLNPELRAPKFSPLRLGQLAPHNITLIICSNYGGTPHILDHKTCYSPNAAVSLTRTIYYKHNDQNQLGKVLNNQKATDHSQTLTSLQLLGEHYNHSATQLISLKHYKSKNHLGLDH